MEKLPVIISQERIEEQNSAKRLLEMNANLYKSIVEGFTVSLMGRRLKTKKGAEFVEEFSRNLENSIKKVLDGLDGLLYHVDETHPLKEDRKSNLEKLKEEFERIKSLLPATSLYQFENLLENSFDKTVAINAYAATALLNPLYQVGLIDNIKEFLNVYSQPILKNYLEGKEDVIVEELKNKKGRSDKRIYAYFELNLILDLSKEGIIKIPREKLNYSTDGGYWESYGLNDLKIGLKKFEKERRSPKIIVYSYLQADLPLCRARILLDCVNHLLRNTNSYEFYRFL